uniref:Uncharacterized protein n=1 Tax=Hommersandiophycus borowitzkae TaxID=268573 RepID=A0A1G4NU91_9FLOR|nr:Hypothetical protein ORF_6 [Hommersandiophycus borowitzkae]SCW22261.1 Hypothetical protein ORF_6 [Hommersandiophycus borowitzkae]
MFLYHNYDMLVMSLQSLDAYAHDKLTNHSCHLNILELFMIKTSNIMQYTETSHYHKLYYIMIMTQDLSYILLNNDIQTQTYKILKDIINHNKELSLNPYLPATSNYMKRFILNYRQCYAPYLIGHNKYSSDKYLTQLSLINLFLLYKFYEKEGVYFIFFYLLYNYHQL